MRGFDRYQAERARLVRACDTVSSIADRAMSSRSDFERLVTSDRQDDESSPAAQLVSEARNRLASSTIEVGIFGSIKRGKSTLINALVGADISPMRVTPETAIPVWIESGHRSTSVVLADGSVLDDVEPDQAREMCTQRYKPKDAERKPVRVMHRYPIDWLPLGVRIVDTPGLDDPSLAEDYEKLTLAELDRVAAAVLVLVSPPGPAGDEIRLLRTLAERGVDKLFLVCNFYPDHWADPDIRKQMTDYIEMVVADGAATGIERDDIRVFPVQARTALRSVLAGDAEGFAEAGVAELRLQLGEYLTGGVLERMIGFVDRRLDMARQIVADSLLQRQTILAKPELAAPIRQALKSELDRSRLTMDEIKAELAKTGRSTTAELEAILTAPFETAIKACANLTKLPEVDELTRRLRLQFETAISEAATTSAQETELAYARVHRKLYDSLGVADRITTQHPDLGGSLRTVEVTPNLPTAKADWSSVAMAGLAGGAGVGTIAGTIAGGAGLALLALGPVGWLVGAGLGALFGGGLSAAAARRMQRDRIDDAGRHSLAEELTSKMQEVRRKAQRSVATWASESGDALDRLRTSYFRNREEDLARVEKIIHDADARNREITRIDGLLDELKRSAATA